MRSTFAPLTLSLLSSSASAINTQWMGPAQSSNLEAHRSREHLHTSTPELLSRSTTTVDGTTYIAYGSSFTIKLYNSSVSNTIPWSLSSIAVADAFHHPDSERIGPNTALAGVITTSEMSNLTMTTATTGLTATETGFTLTTLTPSLTLASTDTVIELAPTTTTEIDVVETTAGSTDDIMATITSYTTVGGQKTGQTTAATTTAPALAGQNSGTKLGMGAWTVAVLGLGSVIAGLML